MRYFGAPTEFHRYVGNSSHLILHSSQIFIDSLGSTSCTTILVLLFDAKISSKFMRNKAVIPNQKEKVPIGVLKRKYSQ